MLFLSWSRKTKQIILTIIKNHKIRLLAVPKPDTSLTEGILNLVRQSSETKLIKCKVAPEHSFTLQMNRRGANRNTLVWTAVCTWSDCFLNYFIYRFLHEKLQVLFMHFCVKSIWKAQMKQNLCTWSGLVVTLCFKISKSWKQCMSQFHKLHVIQSYLLNLSYWSAQAGGPGQSLHLTS